MKWRGSNKGFSLVELLIVIAIMALLAGALAPALLRYVEEARIRTDEEKAAKIAVVIGIYDSLGVGEEAKNEIIKLNDQALAYASALDLQPEAYELLENYSKKLIGRNK